jgi:arabinofuranosyltransferase
VASVNVRSAHARTAFRILLAVFLGYAGLFIYRTSFVVGGERYFSLFDDAMISMRYARNLAHGYGLVWNPGGERVEGFTNPLWVLYMAVIHLFPLPPSKTSVVVQTTAAALLWLNLIVVRAIGLEATDGCEPVALGAAALTASYLPLNNWSLQGMEVCVLLPVVSGGLWLALRSMRDGRFRRSPYILLGASTLVRADMVVALGALALFLAATDAPNRRRHIGWASAAFLFFIGLQTALRVWYFGDILPNTYYLKLTGYPVLSRVARGAYVTARFVWTFNIVLFAAPLVLLVRRNLRAALLLWMFAAQLAYSVYVGGDAWEYWGGSNRYVVIAMPAFFIALAWSLFIVGGAVVNATGLQSATATATSRADALVYVLLIVVTILSANSIHGAAAWAEVLLVRPPLHTGTGDENHQEVEEALRLRAITTDDATLAVTRAGTIPYFADRPSVDLLGKSDRHLAREPSRVPSGPGGFMDFRPGHSKFDYRYSVELLAPDVVVQLWEHREEVVPYLRRFYTGVAVTGKCVYARQASPHVHWEMVSAARCGELAN